MEDFGKNILLWAPLVIILIAVMYMRVRQDRIKDLYAPTEEKKKSVSKELRGFALPRKNKVLDDVTVVSYGHTGYADHMLIGPFGVLLVYDLCTPGAYYGAVQDQKWTISNTTKEQRIQVDNPFIAADACSGRVITLLKKNGYKVPVYRMAVIVGGKKEIINYIKSDEIVLLKEMRKYLKQSKFDQDNDVDVDAIVKILEQPQE